MDPFSILHNKNLNTKSITQEAFDVTKMNAFEELELSNYNSFIFGNSKCNGFTSFAWKQKLLPMDSILNLSSPGENITHIHNKIKYLVAINSNLKNVLIVLDDNIFRNYKEDFLIGPVYMHHSISTNSSKLKNIKKGFQYFLDDLYYIKYFRKVLNINNPSLDFIKLNGSNKTIRYNSTLKIISKKKLNTEVTFSDSIPQFNYSYQLSDSIKLVEIKETFNKMGTNYKIIIGPYSNNTHFSYNLRNLCSQVFGKDNFYDFSGSRKYKWKVKYWNDRSHFKVMVGDQILSEIYNK